jgi:hypothetical protein
MMKRDYMISLRSEVDPSDTHRKNTIISLCKFAIFKNTKTKSFREITREDVLSLIVFSRQRQ